MDRNGPDGQHEDIAQALEQAAALVRRLIGGQGLSLTARSVLATLGVGGPVRLTALAEGACLSQPSMTQLIQRLERDGLATRVSDPADRRATLVGITDAGRVLVAELRAGLRGRLAELLATLSVEDETTLTLAMHVALPIIQRLNDNATQRTPAWPPRPDRSMSARSRVSDSPLSTADGTRWVAAHRAGGPTFPRNFRKAQQDD
jgi:DNA-binding MarR family transcriptional regulator